MRAHASLRAPSTQRAYASDWRHFDSWCSAHEHTSLPATPDTIVAYLEDCATRLRPSTIGRRLVAIAAAHKAARHVTPTTHPDVTETMQAIRRSLGTAPAQKDPITLVQLRRMVDGLGAGLADRRDRAVLLVGFAGAFRRSELAGLDVSDVLERPEGLLMVLRRSKTDQEGRGRNVPIPLGAHPETCPVRALRAWLDASAVTDGPLFRAVDAHGRVGPRLSGGAVARIVKRAATRAGLDPARFSGHSLRAGFVTEAFEAGISELRIAEQTGHRSLTVLRDYIRRKDPFRSTAASQLGL